jgi:hypothetical protein
MGHQPALPRPKQGCEPRAGIIDLQKRFGLPAHLEFKGGMIQDLIRGHCHGASLVIRAKKDTIPEDLSDSHRQILADCFAPVVSFRAR